jgi:phasin family protein
MTASKKTTKADAKAEAKTAENEAVNAVEAAVAVSKEAVEKAVKAGNEAATKGYEQAVSATKEQVEAATKAGAETFKGYEGVFAFHKSNFDAAMAASDIWMNGVKDLNTAFGAFASKSVDQSVSSTKALLKCTTVEDVVALNSEAAKSSYDSVVAETQNIREMSIKLAETSAKPLASRVNETVAQFSKRAA